MPYLPQWRARAAAVAVLGDDAFIWKKGARHFVGLKFANGSKVALGEGADWREAIDTATRNAPAPPPDRLT